MKNDNLMNKYINEEVAVLNDIINHRKEILQDFIDLYVKEDIEQIIIIGSGTSYHSGVVTKHFIENLLNVQVSVQYPTLFENYHNIYNKKTLVLGISQGGSSTSTVNGIKKANELGLLTLGITAEQGSHITEVAQNTILVECGEEKAGPKTKGYVATLLTLYLLAIEIACGKAYIDNNKYQQYLADINKTINNINYIIDESEKWYEKNMKDFVETNRIIVIGHGVNYGTALEGGLKLLETIRCPVQGYELEEFMHGIYNSLDKDTYIIYLGSPGMNKSRMIKLKEFLSNLTEKCYLITDKNNSTDVDTDLAADFIDIEEFSPLEYIVPLQILSCRLSVDKGINPTIPKYPNFHRDMASKIY